MLLDTDSKTVTFTEGEIVPLDKLWEIIYFLDPMDEEPEKLLPPLLYTPHILRYVRSDVNWNREYLVVQLLNGHWLCSCPDFTLRHKDETGETCKHIDRVLYGYV